MPKILVISIKKNKINKLNSNKTRINKFKIKINFKEDIKNLFDINIMNFIFI